MLYCLTLEIHLLRLCHVGLVIFLDEHTYYVFLHLMKGLPGVLFYFSLGPAPRPGRIMILMCLCVCVCVCVSVSVCVCLSVPTPQFTHDSYSILKSMVHTKFRFNNISIMGEFSTIWCSSPIIHIHK